MHARTAADREVFLGLWPPPRLLATTGVRVAVPNKRLVRRALAEAQTAEPGRISRAEWEDLLARMAMMGEARARQRRK